MSNPIPSFLGYEAVVTSDTKYAEGLPEPPSKRPSALLPPFLAPLDDRVKPRHCSRSFALQEWRSSILRVSKLIGYGLNEQGYSLNKDSSIFLPCGWLQDDRSGTDLQ